MAQERVVVTIAPNGVEFTVKTENYKGQGCDAIHKALESVGTTTNTRHTDEYYEAPSPNSVSVGS